MMTIRVVEQGSGDLFVYGVERLPLDFPVEICRVLGYVRSCAGGFEVADAQIDAPTSQIRFDPRAGVFPALDHAIDAVVKGPARRAA